MENNSSFQPISMIISILTTLEKTWSRSQQTHPWYANSVASFYARGRNLRILATVGAGVLEWCLCRDCFDRAELSVKPCLQNYLKWEKHHSFPCQSMIFLLINCDHSPESPTRISHVVKILSSQCGQITSQVQSESLCLTFSKIDFFFLALNSCILNYLLFGYLLSILNKHEQTCNYTRQHEVQFS